MEDDKAVKQLKKNLELGLKHYFDNDISKVKDFANCIKFLGFDLNDLKTLQVMESRAEALITLLGLFDFGVLQSVVKSSIHLQGKGNPDEYISKHINIFNISK